MRLTLLRPKSSDDPKQNLEGFSHIFLSPDGKTLYFEAEAWATSNAVHALDIATKRTSYVTAGGLACVVSLLRDLADGWPSRSITMITPAMT